MLQAFTKATPWLVCAAVFAVSAQAQTARPENNTAKVIPGQIVVDQATRVVDHAKENPAMAALIDHAKAVLIVPRYGQSQTAVVNRAEQAAPSDNTTRSAVALTRNGSPGVFLVHSAGNWSSPAFFSVTRVNGSAMHSSARRYGMPVVMVFMTAKAADELARSGIGAASLSHLDVARYLDHGNKSLADADVVVWTPRARYGQYDRSAQHDRLGQRWIADHEFHFDSTASNAYYMNQVSLANILSTNVSTPRSSALQGALSTKVASAR
jgi:hypothetical protein